MALGGLNKMMHEKELTQCLAHTTQQMGIVYAAATAAWETGPATQNVYCPANVDCALLSARCQGTNPDWP